MQTPNQNSHKFCAVVILICLAVILYLAVGHFSPTSNTTSPPEKVTQSTSNTASAIARSINVYFSPKGGCEDAILSEINNAKSEILVNAYRLSNTKIIEALGKAFKRGIAIEIVIDEKGSLKSIEKVWGETLQILMDDYSPIYIDTVETINHNKVMIIDRTTIITGSFNFTNPAQDKNAENLLIMKGYPELVAQYVADFEKHKGHDPSNK